MPNITFQNLSVTYTSKKSEVVAINRLNLDLETGKTHVIVGFSGCGKTTLLKTMFSNINYEGKVLVNGEDIEKTPVEKRNLAYVSQNYALYPSMTIFDNIAFPLKMLGASSEEIKKRVYEVATELNIMMCLSRKPRHISGGQQQRVALARALVKNPSICLFDEPLSNLDQATANKSKDLIYNSIKSRNITTIYVTHNMEEATSLGDIIHFMKDGEILFSGTPEEFIHSDNPIIVEFLQAL